MRPWKGRRHTEKVCVRVYGCICHKLYLVNYSLKSACLDSVSLSGREKLDVTLICSHFIYFLLFFPKHSASFFTEEIEDYTHL